MRKIVGLALATALGIAGAASAQVSLDPNQPKAIASILEWRGDYQAQGFRDIEHIFKTNTIKRGAKVHPLPVAAQQIAPTFTYKGKTWTIDDYMKAYRVSGLLVLKDGQIVLEKYALGRKPADRAPPPDGQTAGRPLSGRGERPASRPASAEAHQRP